ncbi:ABC transporter ATP-binding protein [Streptomyces sp. NPDC004752]
MASVELRHVAKRFGSVTAVADTSFSLDDGESLVILGPSGSGKSTLLRIIAGLEAADDGEIVICGVPQSTLPAHKRDIAIVFQHFALYPHLSARDNITLGLRHGIGLSKQEANDRAHDIAARLGISELLGRLPRQMSGGQRQRVALARALARQAAVVLLDEPLSGLDAQLRISLRAEIAEIMRSTAATTIHVTHDQTDAMAMADRVAVVRAGRIEQLGTPQQVYDQPASLFVATFVGTPPMNTIQASVIDAGVWETPFTQLRLPDVRQDTDLTLGIRSEAMAVNDDSKEYTVSAEVVLREHEGSSAVLHLRTAASGLPAVTLRARIAATRAVTPGETVRLGFDAVDVHVFGADELRLGTLSELKEQVRS